MHKAYIPIIARTRTQMATWDNNINTIGLADSVRQHPLDPLTVYMTDSAYNAGGAVSTTWGNLITNGTFADTASWTSLTSTLTVVDGALRMTNTGNVAGGVRPTGGLTTVAAAKYIVQVDVVGGTSRRLRMSIGDGSAGLDIVSKVVLADGNTHTLEFTAKDTGSHLSFRTESLQAGEYSDIDNVTVHRVPSAVDLEGMTLFTSAAHGQPWVLAAPFSDTQYANNAVNNITNTVTTLYPNFVYENGVMIQRPA